MQSIALILDSRSAKDFRISDINIIGVDSDTEVRERLIELINKKEFKIIIINRDLIGGLSMEIKKMMEENRDPLLIPIDINKDKPIDLKGGEELSRMLYRAIGAQLRNGDKIKDGN